MVIPSGDIVENPSIVIGIIDKTSKMFLAKGIILIAKYIIVIQNIIFIILAKYAISSGICVNSFPIIIPITSGMLNLTT